jgi:phospholipid transport system substrate-binding protein
MRYRVTAGALFAMIVLASLTTAAPSPRGALQEFFGRATAILSEAADPKEARDDVRQLAQGLFDGRSVARRALGLEWERLTSREREEVTRMFMNALERAYFEMVDARLPRNWLAAVRFTGEDAAGNRVAVVGTTIRAKDDSDIRMDYIMVRPREAWLVHDVVIDGVSLVEDYGAQFARILRPASAPDL